MSTLAGIYKITCIKNGKFYIGSSVNLKNRLDIHKRELEKGRHYNNKLQNSYNKYGKDNFIFEIIDIFDSADITFLRQIEQNYLDNLQPFDERGFNLQKFTQLYRKKSEVPNSSLYLLISPEGDVYHNYKFVEGKKTRDTNKLSLAALSLSLNLPAASLNSIVRGRYKSYKGWTNSFYNHQILKRYGTFRCLGGKKPKKYILSDQNGNNTTFFNIAEFARNNNLKASNVSLLLKGCYSSYLGWFNPQKFSSLKDAEDYGKSCKRVCVKQVELIYKDEISLWARSCKDADRLTRNSNWFDHKLHAKAMSKNKLKNHRFYKEVNLLGGTHD